MQRWQTGWQTTARGSAVIVVGLMLLATGLWWGVLRGGRDPGSPPGARNGAVDAEPVGVAGALDLIPGCRQDTCRVAASRGGFRYGGRPARLVVIAERSADCGGRAPVRIHLLGPDGVTWSGPADAVCGEPLGGIETDRAGHAFVRFPAGGPGEPADRLVVLRIGDDAVDDFGSLEGRFTGDGVSAGDLDDDRVHEIVVPSEEGSTVHRWTGSGWRERG